MPPTTELPKFEPHSSIACHIFEHRLPQMIHVSGMYATLTCKQVPNLLFHGTSEDGQIRDWTILDIQDLNQIGRVVSDPEIARKIIKGIIDRFVRTGWQISFNRWHRYSGSHARKPCDDALRMTTMAPVDVFFEVREGDHVIIQFIDSLEKHAEYPMVEMLKLGDCAVVLERKLVWSLGRR